MIEPARVSSIGSAHTRILVGGLFALALSIFILVGCGPPSPTEMTVGQWIKLDQEQREEALGKLPKAYPPNCEKRLYNSVMLGNLSPQIMEARLPDAARMVCGF